MYIWLQQEAIPATNIGSRWVVHKRRLRPHLEATNVVRLAALNRSAIGGLPRRLGEREPASRSFQHLARILGCHLP